MKTILSLLAALVLTLNFATPVEAHCGACGVGGDAESCDETKGTDCADHPEEEAK